MSEARPRPMLASISPNSVAKPESPQQASCLPLARNNSISRSPRRVFMDQLPADEDTQASFPKSDDSIVSDLSLLADEAPTDDIDRKILEHARWNKRAALESGPLKLQTFGKAKTRSGLASMMGEIDRRHGVERAIPEPERNPEPSSNIPRQWGRKGKQRNDFLRRLTAPDVTGQHFDQDQDLAVSSNAGKTHTENLPSPNKGIDIAVPDMPLPSVEGQSPLRRELSREQHLAIDASTNPAAADRRDEARPTKTFAFKLPRVDNASRPTELHNVESRAVTTSRLGNMEYVARKNTGSLYRALPPAKVTDSTSDITDEQLNERFDLGSRIPRKHGSRDLLRQLSRAGSSTPSPSPATDHRVAPNPGRVDIVDQKLSYRGDRSSIPAPRGARSPRRETTLVPPSEHRLPTPPDEAKTPIVTGAWNGTPAIRNDKGILEQDVARKPATQIPKATKPTRGENFKHQPKSKSALETIILSGDRDISDNHLDESTIASLKDLVAQDETGDLSAILQLDEDTLNLVSNVNMPISQGQELRAEEKEALRRMSAALKSARIGLRDASRGIQRVEHQVEQAEKKQGHSHTSGGTCDQCGCASNVTLSGLLFRAWTWYRSFYYTWPRNSRLPRFTWLGLVTLVAMTWLFTEVTLCEFYCHPIYARSMVGYGIDYNAPRLGYVAYTILLKRPFIRFFGPPWKFLQWLLIYVVQFFFPDFMKSPEPSAEAIRKATEDRGYIYPRSFGPHPYLAPDGIL